MSESAKEREERMQRAAAGKGRERPGAGPTTRGETAQRTKPIRLSVDLDPPLHYRLDNWSLTARTELDVPRVPAAAVVRVLINRLTNVKGSDPQLREMLQQAVMDDLRDTLR
ncbi:hypothetical protein [Streptomyces sp. NPDC047939]|uniref:hypothetical protein n=1 Tax=Streptomyces sp. NPDC047939 TaxID=3155381 RepID=UPI0034431105